MRDALRDVARAQLAEIEPRAEMVAFARQHDGFDPSGTAAKKASMPNTVGSSMALRFSGRCQKQNHDVAVAFGLERPRQSHVQAATGFAHRDPQISHLTWVR